MLAQGDTSKGIVEENWPELFKGSLGYNIKTLSQNKYSSKVSTALKNKVCYNSQEPTGAYAGDYTVF